MKYEYKVIECKKERDFIETIYMVKVEREDGAEYKILYNPSEERGITDRAIAIRSCNIKKKIKESYIEIKNWNTYKDIHKTIKKYLKKTNKECG